MGIVRFGGFIVTTKNGNFIKGKKIDDQTLQKVADLLGISAAEQAQLASDFTSIFIYRGTDPPAKKPP